MKPRQARAKERKIRKNIARERVSLLLTMSKEAYMAKHKLLSQLYTGLAFTIVKRFKIKLTDEQKYSFCRKCMIPWIEGETVDVKIERKGDTLIKTYTCLNCGYVRRKIKKINAETST